MRKKIRHFVSQNVRQEITSFYVGNLERTLEQQSRKKIILSDQLEALTGGKDIVLSSFSEKK